MQDIHNIIESLLFVADEPLSIDKIRQVLETVETREIRTALNTLSEHYDSRGGGFKLYEVAGGWQLRSRPEYNEWIKRMLQPSPQRLSKPALETLAIVAYNQPIIRTDIEYIRGVDCGGVLRQLMERKLIRVLGRKEIPGRPLIYATTKLFLELFGLKDLKDLPSPKEIEEMAAAITESEPALKTDEAGLQVRDGLLEPAASEYITETELDRHDSKREPGSTETRYRWHEISTSPPAGRTPCRRCRSNFNPSPKPRIESRTNPVSQPSLVLPASKNKIF